MFSLVMFLDLKVRCLNAWTLAAVRFAENVVLSKSCQDKGLPFLIQWLCSTFANLHAGYPVVLMQKQNFLLVECSPG